MNHGLKHVPENLIALLEQGENTYIECQQAGLMHFDISPVANRVMQERIRFEDIGELFRLSLHLKG